MIGTAPTCTFHVLVILASRTQAIDGSLAGLEVSQGEMVRRLTSSVNAALMDAESMLQVRHTAWNCLFTQPAGARTCCTQIIHHLSLR
jgi:hypothetical protein